MTWHIGLSMKRLKDLKTRGELYSKLFNNYKNLRVDKTKSMAWRDLCPVVGITEQRAKAFLTGLFEDIPEETFLKLLNIIEMQIGDFNSFAKKTAISGIGIYDKALITPTASNTPTEAVAASTKSFQASVPSMPALTPSQKTTPAASTAPAAKTMRLENYTEEPLIVIYDKAANVLTIHPNYPDAKVPNSTTRQVVLLHNAVSFYNKISPGKGNL